MVLSEDAVEDVARLRRDNIFLLKTGLYFLRKTDDGKEFQLVVCIMKVEVKRFVCMRHFNQENGDVWMLFKEW